MINLKKIAQLARHIQEVLPKNLRNLDNNIEKKIRQILKNQFNRMNLISRDEFDAQTQVLLRLNEKINQFELRIHTIETTLKMDHTTTTTKPKCEVHPTD